MPEQTLGSSDRIGFTLAQPDRATWMFGLETGISDEHAEAAEYFCHAVRQEKRIRDTDD